MKLHGKLIRERKIMRDIMVENNQPDLSYRDRLEKCLVEVCAGLEIPVPLWLDKNTKEFIAYHKTIFTNEQFMDRVWFDKFEIRVEG